MTTPRQRSYSGCWSCRRRRRKCDGARPSCRNCERRGVPCEGYEVRLRWGAGIASRGHFAGAEKPVLGTVESSPSPRPPVESGSSESRPVQQPTTVTPPGQESAEVQASELLQKFFDSGHHILLSVRESRDVFKTMAVLWCQESKACAAVCVALQTLLEPELLVRFEEYFDIALQRFRAEMARTDVLSQGTLAAGNLLCTVSFFHGKPWTFHVHGLYRHLTHSPPSSSILHSPDPACHSLIGALGIMDLPPFIAGRRSPAMHIWYYHCRGTSRTWLGPTSTNTSTTSTGGIEPITGLPRSLIDLFSCIGFSPDQDVESGFWSWPGEEGSAAQVQLWEAYRFAGVLAIRRHWHSHHFGLGLDGSGIGNESSSNEAVTSRIVGAIDALNRAAPDMDEDDEEVFNAIRYPLVVAGSDSEVMRAHPEWKGLIEGTLRTLVEEDPYAQCKLTFEVLSEVWSLWEQGKDIGVDGLTLDRGVELFLVS